MIDASDDEDFNAHEKQIEDLEGTEAGMRIDSVELVNTDGRTGEKVRESVDVCKNESVKERMDAFEARAVMFVELKMARPSGLSVTNQNETKPCDEAK